MSLIAALGTPTTAHELADSFLDVIVVSSSSSEARRMVVEVGGKATRSLPIVDGVAARVPARSLRTLSSKAIVTPDGKVGFQADADFTATPQRIGKIVRSDALWAEGVTGSGVTVALLDTGVYANHPDLAGRVVHCQDLSHEAGTAAHCADTFGHGTFMAGLIAGDGASSGGTYKGTAPGAKIVSVKLAGFDGSADVSNVLAGIQWVVAHKSKYGIRVMNMSLGTNSTQTYLLSTLNFAVQKAWKSGIVVIVSAGNSGPDSRTVLKPADDPYVVTVGASDDQSTLGITDDRVAAFSGRGPTASNGVPKPDVVAPGVHTVSLRAPGSAIDQAYGATAVVGTDYFRGTGTSMAAASVTGVVAQMLQSKSWLAPDQVKYRLMTTARKIADTSSYAAGRGMVDAYAATKSSTTGKANQGLLLGLGNGLGSLQSARGTLDPRVYTPAGEVSLTGSYQAQSDPKLIGLSNPLGLVPFVNLTYTLTGWDPLTWALTSFVKVPWAPLSWDSTRWKQTMWDSTRWKGTDWYNADWDSTRWKDVDWDSTRWKATVWQSAWYAAGWE